MANEKAITERECNLRHDDLDGWMNKIETKLERVEGRFWWLIALLIGNLAGVIVLLLKR